MTLELFLAVEREEKLNSFGTVNGLVDLGAMTVFLFGLASLLPLRLIKVNTLERPLSLHLYIIDQTQTPLDQIL